MQPTYCCAMESQGTVHISRIAAASRAGEYLFRNADWLHAKRARLYGRLFCGLAILAIAIMIASARGGVDVTGKPLGTDFLSFWSASRLALAGT
jgi:hypothetical protein